ncbi:hypothetical protein IC235_06735 [Hymenobacter sp. BT664]|uniref:Uncharacterized protein n=1 Tax=Hymenobacter montanus TaxID=2771359 RepID=A0A927BBA0_9BACT|nr:hypothetical protein [Hymenobacter montanus]MBD2767585.1 hypothetical protein [Hymenobacter montanus]
MNEYKDASKESFNDDFCSYLEHHLTRAFANAEDELVQKVWCDGVLMPFFENQTSKKSVNDTKRIVTKAWIGQDGQGEYELVIKFEKYSLRKYARGSSLQDCVPSERTLDWINIDLARRTIEIQLT